MGRDGMSVSVGACEGIVGGENERKMDLKVKEGVK